MKTFAKILSLLLVVLMVASILVACKKDEETADNGEEEQKEAVVNYQDIDLKDAVARTDYTSVYSEIGSQVTIDMVTENDDGTATVTVDGVTYTLGMDFLSMAMVYNCTVPTGSTKYTTEEDVYNEWWKLYIQRWNMLIPEVPLYSNQYFDVYYAKFQNFVTSPYWGLADAIVGATVDTTKGTNTAILGNATELGGDFRNAAWGKSSAAASDLDIQNLTTGYSTVMSDFDGNYLWNMDALAVEPTDVINADGTLTYTIQIKTGLKFSDGSAITAKNYIAYLLANSTPVAAEAKGSGTAGLQVVGYKAFNAGTATYFTGVKLLDDYTFSVTYDKDYANYYYKMTLAGYSPAPLALYLGTAGDIIVDPDTKACGLNEAFYAKTGEGDAAKYVVAEEITANLEWNSSLPYSGPYYVFNYDDTNKIATLKLNDQYTKDVRGTASIETITYIKVVEETQLDQFLRGEVEVLAAITGGDETKAALKAVNESNGAYKETHYDRAGYGKLAFRCDYGPTMFQSVRQAITYTINRPEFAETFTGGYGMVVHGPYYIKNPAYLAVKDEINLNTYTYSSAKAVQVLVADGWIYNVKGQTFTPGTDEVRYKKLSGYELTADNLNFTTIDGKYKTVKIDGAYYMPLAINYYGTQPNTVTDQLITAWQSNAVATKDLGMYIQYISTTFIAGLYGEYFRIGGYGYDGTPKVNAINFAAGFNSATYDFAYSWTIDPELYDDYSNDYLMDEADFFANYSK